MLSSIVIKYNKQGLHSFSSEYSIRSYQTVKFEKRQPRINLGKEVNTIVRKRTKHANKSSAIEPNTVLLNSNLFPTTNSTQSNHLVAFKRYRDPQFFDEERGGQPTGDEPEGFSEQTFSEIYIFNMKKMFPVFLLRSLRQHASTLFTSASHESTNLFKGESGDNVMTEIEQRAEEVYSKNTDLITDRASEAHLAMSCIILASYDTLSKTLSHDDTMLLLQHALCENLHSWMQYIVKVPIYVEPNPIPTLSSVLQSFCRIRGKSFYVETIENVAYLNVNVKRCFFNDFFLKNKCSYLTSLFCNAEQKLLQGIKPITHNLRFDLNGKLSEGHRLCKFQFRKMELLKDFDLV